MNNMKSTHVKILFKIKKNDGICEIESVWAKVVPEGYKIDNIPFYAFGIAYDDVVEATLDDDGMLNFSKLIIASGHSTIRLWVAEEQSVKKIRDELREMGCSSELEIKRLIAVDVPPFASYTQIKKYLERQENNGVFEYEEACLGQA